MAKLLEQEFQLGDVVWSRISGSSWWPVQVVDENCVASKPRKRKNNQVLVRVYGTSEHIYVEPSNCVSKTDKIFGEEKCEEVLRNALNEDLALLNPSFQSKGWNFQLKENGSDEPPEVKKQRKGQLKRSLEEEDLELVNTCDNPRTAKDFEVGMKNGIDAEDGVTKQDDREDAELKRRTRSKKIKAESAKNSDLEVSIVSGQLISRGSIIRCNSKHKDATERANTRIHDVKQDFVWNHMNNSVHNGYSDGKSIKQLVTKIVKEVAAENAKKQALNVKVEDCPENTKSIENSWKGSYERIDGPCPDEFTGQSDTRASLIEATGDHEPGKQDFEYCNDENSKHATGDQGTIGSCRVTRSKTMCQREPVEHKGTQAKIENQGGATNPTVAAVARNGERKGKVMKQDSSREKMKTPVSTKCTTVKENEEQSRRSRRVMQSLGLIAPSGSPFHRNGSSM